MSSPHSVGSKMRRTMGFALMVAFLSLGVISGCDLGIDDDYDFLEPDRPDGGLDAVDPNAGIYPNIQVIQPFLSGAIDPIKVQYWDQTYYWGPDSDGNDACFKGTVGIEDSSSLAQETAPGPECPTSLGQVTPCNPAAAADTVASGAVQPAISGCEHDGAACTDILVPDITDEVTCESTVRQADPIAAGAAWFQNIDAPGTKGGTASHWWYGTRADKTFDAEDGYGGTQIDYISDATNINIAASGGGSGPTTRVNNIYLCSNKDVVNPAESSDVCTLSSLFGSCGYAANGDPGACKINNIGLVDGAYNVFIRSATPSEGFGGEDGPAVQAARGSVACAAADPINQCCVTSATLRAKGTDEKDVADALATALNACFMLVPETTALDVKAIGTGPRSPAQAGVLLHGWDGTDNGASPWLPGNGQSVGDGAGARWSSSYINNYNVSYPGKDTRADQSQDPPRIKGPTVSMYSVFQGGSILSIPDTQVNCVFGADAGTDSRAPSAERLVGCGTKKSQLVKSQWCGPDCTIGDRLISTACANNAVPDTQGVTEQCSIKPQKIAAMLVLQRQYSCVTGLGIPAPCASLPWSLNTAYNEVVVEPDTQAPKNTISASYNPRETSDRDYPSDPRVNACNGTTNGAANIQRPLRANGKDMCCLVDMFSRTLESPLNCVVAPPNDKSTSTCKQLKGWDTLAPPLLALDVQSIDKPFSAGDCEAIHGAGTVCPGDDVCSSEVTSKFGRAYPNIQPKP